MADLKDYSNTELIAELEYRGYNFLDDLSDSDLEDEIKIRDLDFDSYITDSYIIDEFIYRGLKLPIDDELESTLDLIYNLYKSYVCKDSDFDAKLKKFFSEALNINVV